MASKRSDKTEEKEQEKHIKITTYKENNYYEQTKKKRNSDGNS